MTQMELRLCFLHRMQSINPVLLPHVMMDLPISAIAYWDTLLIYFPSGGSYLDIPPHFLSVLAALMSADFARILCSLVCSCFTSYRTYHLFPLLISFVPIWTGRGGGGGGGIRPLRFSSITPKRHEILKRNFPTSILHLRRSFYIFCK